MKLSDALEILQRELTEHGDRELKRGADSLATLLTYLTRDDARQYPLPHFDLLQALTDIDYKAPDGAMVSIARLRDETSMPRATLDATLFAAARSGLVSLFRHDFPHGLDPEDREQLLIDGPIHYNAVAIRSLNLAQRKSASV